MTRPDEVRPAPEPLELAIELDGAIGRLCVVGLHGVLHPRMTPAIRWPIYALDDGRHAEQIKIEGIRATCVAMPANVEEGGGESSALPNATRVGPWCANVNRVLLALGPQEREALGAREPRSSADPEVARLLRRLQGLRSPGDVLVSEPDRAGTFVWYAKLDSALALREALSHHARSALKECADVRRHGEAFTAAAWWLSRCAWGISELDVLRAAAALKLAGHDGYDQLRRAVTKVPVAQDLRFESAMRECEGWCREAASAAAYAPRCHRGTSSEKRRGWTMTPEPPHPGCP